MNIDFTAELETEKKRERKLNRFSVSEVWGLLNGYKTIEEYISGEKRKAEEVWKMRLGTAKHEIIEELLKEKYDVEIKKEMQFEEVELVGKADILDKQRQWLGDIKTSDKLNDKSKRWHDYQVKMYLSMFEVETGYIWQPVSQNGKYYLKTIGIVKRDDKFFERQILKVKEIYKQIEKHGTKLQTM